jgi:predicted nucleic acid-binding protein
MICIDSDCIIDFLKGKKEAIEIVNQYKDEIITTEINIFEVFFGVYSRKQTEEESTGLFFGSMEILDSNKRWGIGAARILGNLIKEGRVIEQNDSLIASIMLSNDCNKIITKNEKHFSKIKGIEVMTY